MTHILEHFKKVDPKLYPYVEKFIGDLVLSRYEPKDYFERICRAIAFQQLTGKAATTIYNRVLDLFPNKTYTPELLIKIDHEKLRAAGLSNAKARYMKNIAEAQVDGLVDFNKVDKLSDEEVIAHLVQIKGVGTWTAEMFLIFSLCRPNVYSHGDLGLKNAVKKLYNIDPRLHTRKLKKLLDSWHPYHSIISRYLWKSLEPKD